LIPSSTSAIRYAAALIAIAVLGGGLGFAAVRLRRRWLFDVDGALAVLCNIVIALALLVVESQLLGSVGLFKLVPLVLGAAVIGLASLRWCRPVAVAAGATNGPGAGVAGNAAAAGGPDPEASVARPPGSSHLWQRPSTQQWALALALLACGATFARWLQPTLHAYLTGVHGFDTLWYHGPFAAQFAQTGWTTHVMNLDVEYYNRFYPATSELLHAVGILVFGYDTLSPGLNLVWVSLTLLAAYCIGAPYKLGPWTLLAGATVTATQMLTASDAGSLDNDIVAVFFLIAAVAIYPDLQAQRAPNSSWARLTLAALTAGLAISVKPTTWVAVTVLTLGAIAIAPRHRHWRTAGLWVAGLFVGGSYWYIRNLVAAGNPITSTRLPLMHQPPMVLSENVSYSVAHFFGQPIMSALLRELSRSLDRYWIWLLAFAAIGALLALIARERRTQLLALVALLAGAAYVVTPNTASSFGGPKWNFFWSIRYIAGPVLLGLALLPTLPALRRGAWRRVTFAVLGCLYLLILIGANRWPIPIVPEALSAVCVLAAAIGLALLRPRLRNASGIATCAVLVLVAVVGLHFEQHRYLHDRYTHPAQFGKVAHSPLAPIYARFQEIHHARVALAGIAISEQRYPLYGPSFDNYVNYLVWTGNDGTLHEYRQCHAWLQALNAGHYNYLVVSPGGSDDHQKLIAQAAYWLRPGPHAHVVLRYMRQGKHYALWQLSGPQPLSVCAKLPAKLRTVPAIEPIADK
jgi:hypothetical protein